jgi:hypothetical protein
MISSRTPVILYPEKLFFQMKKLRHSLINLNRLFISSIIALQKILKEIFQAEIKTH